jgi:hypothetical protein
MEEAVVFMVVDLLITVMLLKIVGVNLVLRRANIFYG